MIKYPFTVNDLMNTDALAKAILMLQEEVKNFVVANTIKYADPIQWNITTQYERNTVVIDPLTGTAYISVQPVPMGVSLANTDYWTVVFNLSEFVTRAARNFSLNYEENTTLTATFPTVKGGWLVWNDTLYVANVNITPGDQYVDELGGNITRITMESIIGNMDDLLTTHKDNMVNIINEVYTAYTTLDTIIGDMSTLDVPDVTTVVAALNVLYAAVNNIAEAIIEISGFIGNLDSLNTTDKSSIVAAINEVLSDTNDVNNKVGDLTSLTTTDKSTAVTAINEVNSNVGDLNSLTTTDKSSIVAAINNIASILPSLPFATPKDYGAVGDGVTDDTAAIQNCIDENNYVLFTDGTYKCTEIQLHSNMYIIGVNAIIKGAYAITTRVFSGNNISDVIIEGLKFEGTGYNNALAAILNCFTLHFVHTHNITIRNCELYNTQDRGVIYVDDSHDFHIEHCCIHDYPYSGTIFMCGCHDCWFEDNHVYNYGSTAEVNTYGMSIAGYMSGYNTESYNMFVLNNIIETPLCIWEGIDAHGVRDYVISGNTIKGCKTPIVVSSAINPAGYGNARGIIINNIIYSGDNSGTAITIYNGNGVDISNNIIEHSCKGTGAADGVAIDVRTSKNINIVENTITDCGRSGATNQMAVIYLQGVDGFKVNSNVIHDNNVHPTAGAVIKFEVSFYNGDISNNLLYNNGLYFIAGTDGFTPTDSIANVKTHNNNCDTYASYYTNYIVVERMASVANEYEGSLGDIVLNISPTVGNPIGWICTASKTINDAAVWTALANV